LRATAWLIGRANQHQHLPGERARRHRDTAPPKAARPDPGRPQGKSHQQAEDGESLDVRQRQISGYATRNGLTVEKVFVERGVSCSNPLADRPQGSALLAALKSGDVVITPKLDRMFGSALDALDVLGKLKSSGVALHMIDLGGETTGNGVQARFHHPLCRCRGRAGPHARTHHRG
jgi:hypothetical protein